MFLLDKSVIVAGLLLLGCVVLIADNTLPKLLQPQDLAAQL